MGFALAYLHMVEQSSLQSCHTGRLVDCSMVFILEGCVKGWCARVVLSVLSASRIPLIESDEERGVSAEDEEGGERTKKEKESHGQGHHPNGGGLSI